MRVVFNVGKYLLLLLLVWLIVLLGLSGSLLKSGEGEELMARKLLEAQTENLALRRERDSLKRKLRDMENIPGSRIEPDGDGDGMDDDDGGDDGDANPPGEDANPPASRHSCVPSLEYEQYRRRAVRDVRELWNLLRSQLDQIMKESTTAATVEKKVSLLRGSAQSHVDVLLLNLQQMREHDGYDQWRRQEAKDLSALVQARLSHLQNPASCDSARKLLCNLNKGCGYGCQIHHAVYCFITAYGTERTLILQSKGWRYNKNGFQHVFLPLSETCTSQEGSSRANWPGNEHTQVVEMPIVDSVNPRPAYLPPAIPADLAHRISRLHGDPIVWWLGQFLLYMLRPQNHLKEMLGNTVSSLKFQNPVVGIHVRRTDKVGTEAAFHPVEEYMKYVEEWFNRYELNQTLPTRRVFVASDDPKVLGECIEKYPNYVFIGDQEVAKSAAVASRYTDSSLRGVIQDIHLLSLSDYLVCTFSSQVCRIAYEIMQQRHVDASDRFKSLDDIFYFGGQSEHQQEAVYKHQAAHHTEIDLEPGDIIGVAGNHWDGFNKGRNHRTNRVGLYPEYKTKEKLRIVNFPVYKEVTVP